jgi:hypothetical protein
MRDTDAAETTLADLIADAALVRLPAPRSAVGAEARRVIDLTAAEPRTAIVIPEQSVFLVEGYAEYGS